MLYIIIFIAAILLFVLALYINRRPKEITVLEGTNTALVGLLIDENGYPQATANKVIIRPGQKIIFAGPDIFDIFFKENTSPIDELDIPSKNGIVILEIPKDIFEREQRKQKNGLTNEPKELKYQYGIRANGKVTDPIIIISRL